MSSKNKNVLITGATGFIGLNLVKQLSTKRNYKLKCLVRRNSNINELKKLGVELVYGDIEDKKSLKNMGKNIDIVFHLAAKGDIVSDNEKVDRELFNANVIGTKNLLEECKSVKKFIYFSSIAAVGFTVEGNLDENVPCKPEISYEKSKFKGEQVLKKFAKKYPLKYAIVRPTMVYGEYDLVSDMLNICKLCKKKIFPMFGKGENLMNTTHVSNVVQAVISIAETKKSDNQTYFISDEKPHTLSELVDTIADELSLKNVSIKIPLSIINFGVSIIEPIFKIFNKTPPMTKRRMRVLKVKRFYSIEKAKKQLNYKPIDLKEGIKRTIKWYKLNGYL